MAEERDARFQVTPVPQADGRSTPAAGPVAPPRAEDFKLLVESITDYAIFLLDTEGRIRSWNPGARRFKGYEAEEIIGHHVSIFYPEEEIRAGKPAWMLAQALQHGRVEDEGWRVRKDGTRFWADVVITTLRDPQTRQLVGFSKVTRDLTERQRASERMRQSEERFRLLVEGVKDYAIYMLDLDGRIESWNEGAQRLKGYSEAEILGRNFSIFYTPEDLAAGRPARQLEEAKREGRSEDEGWRVRKDGSCFWANVVITAVRDPKTQRHIGYAKLTRDLTERQRTSFLLRQSEELRRADQKFRGLLESAPDAMVIVTPEARISLVNAQTEKLFGYRREELLGKPAELLIAKRHHSVPGGESGSVFVPRRGEASPRRELTGVRRNGTEFPIEITLSPLETEEGTLISSAIRDISERKRANEELRAANAALETLNRTKDEFLATVSHELRTPLTAILGYTNMLRMGVLREERKARTLEIIERNARSLAQLVEDLLDVSRIITGKLRLDIQPVTPQVVVDAALDAIRPAAEAKEIRLVTDLDPGGPPIPGDPDRLQQVVWNLLTNAIKFTPQKGQVTTSLRRHPSQVEIVVSDTGEGIPAEFLPHLFERFRQADGSTTRPHGGLGLGLSIVRHLVELHGGTVEAESGGPGTGATFTVRLPVVQAAPPPEKRPRGSVFTRSSTSQVMLARLDGAKVLVVDDEDDTRELLASLLESCQAEVHTASSAEDALEMIQALRPQVLISDLSMPVMDGYELIHRLRRLPPEEGGRTPAIALTAFARPEDRARALLVGFDLHVPKPIDPAELIATVARLLQRGA